MPRHANNSGIDLKPYVGIEDAGTNSAQQMDDSSSVVFNWIDQAFHFKSVNSFNAVDFRSSILFDPTVPLKRRIFLCGGCELSFLGRRLASWGHDIYDTFLQKVSSDPLAEFLNNRGERAKAFKPDVIILSATQLLKSTLKTTDPRGRRGPQPTFFSQDEALNELSEGLDQAIAIAKSTIPEAKIVLISNPYLNDRLLPLYEESSSPDAWTIHELHLKYVLKLSQLARKNNCIFLDIDDCVSGFGKVSQKLQPLFRIHEPFGGHPESAGARIVANTLQGILHSIYSTQEKVKVIVLDADNTLWDGVLREDGYDHIANNVRVNILHELQRLSARGILITICSKNDPDQISNFQRAFDVAPRFWQCIAAHRLNWLPKSENIKSIVDELNIGMNSVVFFDDQPFEREEVKSALPTVRVFTEFDLHQATRYVPFLPASPLSDDAKNRTKLYMNENDRRVAKTAAGPVDYSQFLISCKFQLSLNRASMLDAPRIGELIGRTNQQNITLQRYSVEQIAALIQSESHDVWCCSVADKFGDYGMIGAIVSHQISSDEMKLLEVAFSCRAMGKGIEKAFLQKILRTASEKYSKCHIDVKENGKNDGMIEIVKAVGFVKKAKSVFSIKPQQRHSVNFDPWITWVD